MAEFLALYRGRTVSDAELVAICADERIVRKFFEELAAKQAEKDRYVRAYAQRHISEEELDTPTWPN